MLVHAREHEDEVDAVVLDHGAGAGELGIDVVVRRGSSTLALVDVVDGGDVNAVAETLDHPSVRSCEDAAAAEDAKAEAHRSTPVGR